MLVPVVVYLPTLEYGFVFDDRPLLIENPVVQAPRGLGELLTTDLDPHAREHETPATNYLRPLFLAFASGLFQLFGAQPFGWHLVAVLLHGALGGLAFWLLKREGLGTQTALAAAVLFSVHPSHVQSAAWVSGLQDLLFAVLAMLAYLAYRVSADRSRVGVSGLVVLGLATALALLAKEPAVGLVLFVVGELALASWPAAAPRPIRRPWAELGVVVAVAAGYLGYRWAVLGGLAHRFPTAPDLPEALASVPVAVLVYLRDLLLPVDLFLLHPARPIASWYSLPALAAGLGLAAVGGLVVWVIRLRPSFKRPVLWFSAWLAPTLALWAVNPEWMVMDRYLLLPSLGLAWLLARALPLETATSRLAARLGWGLLIASSTILSLLGMTAFRNEDTFWEAAIRADPGSSTAWTAWAKGRSEAGDLIAAQDAIDRAIALDPRAQLPRLRKALLALRRDQPTAAVVELESLVERNPSYLPAWRNLVVAYDRAGDREGVARSLTRGLVLFPNDVPLLTHQVVVLRNQGRPEDALVVLRRALVVAPTDATLLLREVFLLGELGRPEEARLAAQRGLALDPPAAIREQLQALLR